MIAGIQYFVIQSFGLNELQEKVNEKMAKGYVPSGSMQVATTQQRTKSYGMQMVNEYLQPMVFKG